MPDRDDEYDAELAERGDDRAGLDDVDLDPLTDAADDLDEDDDDDDVDDEDEDDDYPDDATEDEIDLVVALYREEGVPSALALPVELANDLDGLIEELRRVPGDAGAVGVVAIENEFFVFVRVRGKVVQVLLSDSFAAHDWPIARDVVDFLALDLPEDEDDSEPIGDLDLFADVGVSELEVEALCEDLDSEPLEVVEAIAEKLGYAQPYDRVAAEFDL
ncbi:tRNA adenosine deaminase-associated protein [Propioniciclava soli]|uniref:tRNA adenosine deaminase-associated protein n=1 Tax=Propioniciclava soli TaxID=2775081 RepID=UPI001E52F0BC|nr:tRNA adenosine deaminase-associated protein [Propioniciclava soli]